MFNYFFFTLHYTRYTKNAKMLSALYRDREQSPLNTAVYWIEYVARYRVNLILKPKNEHLQWYQHSLLDVLVTIVVALTVTAYVTRRIIAKGYLMVTPIIRKYE